MTGAEPRSGDPAAFCALALALQGERPESYVGSPEHLDDVDRLVALAPDPVRGAVVAYRDSLRSGTVSHADPDSDLTETWPDDVQEAIAAIQDYVTSHC